jgi:hypothetical protein
MPIIPVLGRLRWKGNEFEVSLGCIVRPCLKRRGVSKLLPATKTCIDLWGEFLPVLCWALPVPPAFCSL